MKKWILFLTTMLVLMFNIKSWAADFENIPTLVVKGEASIFKPSDQMEITLGVVTSAQDSTVALNENNERMQRIIANLQSSGLDEKDYQTGRFIVRPIYQKEPKDSDENTSAKISRYEVINAIKIKTKKLDLANKIIPAAVQGGANQIDQVNFNFSHPQDYRVEAIQAAAQNALSDASALANALGVKLKRIISVSSDQWQQLPRPMMLSKRIEPVGGYAGNGASPDVIESGKAEIHATVSIIFEIEQ